MEWPQDKEDFMHAQMKSQHSSQCWISKRRSQREKLLHAEIAFETTQMNSERTANAVVAEDFTHTHMLDHAAML